ncbi:MAG: cobyrinate a,c-diamide synthase [bacterium]
MAGSGGDSGKTLVSMGLVASWRRRPYNVAVFKKGPDYIDAAWLKFAAGRPARNLDTYMLGTDVVQQLFAQHSLPDGINLIEGNRGLFDGVDNRGTHSTAELAKLLDAPVILILDVTKVTRTAAAIVLGCQHLDPDVKLAGVILNWVAGKRHERVVREAIESITGIPVVGAIPKLSGEQFLPDRHLGLITPEEHPELLGINDSLATLIETYLDLGQIEEIAFGASDFRSAGEPPRRSSKPKTRARIAYFCDSAFTFYYQDNLEALEAAGAKLLPVSSLSAMELPGCDGLYIGGGFPETHASLLSQNRSLLQSVYKQAQEGLPIYAECGGLIYLCRAISYQGNKHSLAGVFPVDLIMQSKPQGHGYMEVTVDKNNPYFPLKTKLIGHEFHYSKVDDVDGEIETVFNVDRGTGSIQHRDGLRYLNVLASYLHLHAAGVPEWAENFVKLASDQQ